MEGGVVVVRAGGEADVVAEAPKSVLSFKGHDFYDLVDSLEVVGVGEAAF